MGCSENVRTRQTNHYVLCIMCLWTHYDVDVSAIQL
jgi:hypothetical protein